MDITRKVSETYIEWFKAYQYMTDPPIQDREFYEMEKQNPDLLEAVREAIEGCIPNWGNIYFSAKEDDLIGLSEENGQKIRKPFKYLSDGQRSMVGMVAELAYRCVTLNPHLGRNAVKNSAGIVLIDEIDLHLHPKWQRHIVADLKRIFPNIQFVSTTHSPFIVQSLKSDELIILDENLGKTGDPYKKSIEEIAEVEMGLEDLLRSKRFQEMLATAENYFNLIAQGKNSQTNEKTMQLRQKLNQLEEYFSEDAAFIALLKAERKSAKL